MLSKMTRRTLHLAAAPLARMARMFGGGTATRRLTLIVAALALFVSAAFALAPRPAQASHSFWSSTLTVKDQYPTVPSLLALGCNDSGSSVTCASGLTDNTFVLQGTTYTVVRVQSVSTSGQFHFAFTPVLSDKSQLDDRKLQIGNMEFLVSSAGGVISFGTSGQNTVIRWSTIPTWTAGQQVQVGLVDPAVAHAPPTAPTTAPAALRVTHDNPSNKLIVTWWTAHTRPTKFENNAVVTPREAVDTVTGYVLEYRLRGTSSWTSVDTSGITLADGLSDGGITYEIQLTRSDTAQVATGKTFEVRVRGKNAGGTGPYATVSGPDPGPRPPASENRATPSERAAGFRDWHWHGNIYHQHDHPH